MKYIINDFIFGPLCWCWQGNYTANQVCVCMVEWKWFVSVAVVRKPHLVTHRAHEKVTNCDTGNGARAHNIVQSMVYLAVLLLYRNNSLSTLSALQCIYYRCVIYTYLLYNLYLTCIMIVQGHSSSVILNMLLCVFPLIIPMSSISLSRSLHG